MTPSYKIFGLLCALCLTANCAPPHHEPATQPADCPAGFEDLSTWTPSPQGALNAVTVDRSCPSRATLIMDGPDGNAFLGRSVSIASGEPIRLEARFVAACDPSTGILTAGITEGPTMGAVARQDGQLTSQTMTLAASATSGQMSIGVGGHADRPCRAVVSVIIGHPAP